MDLHRLSRWASLPLAAAALLLLLTAGYETPASGLRLVSATPLPDPQLVRCGGEVFLFGTGAEPFYLRGSALEPDSLRSEPLELDLGDWPHRVHQVWGFVVQRTSDGKRHGYGTLHLGQFRTVVAHFEPRGEGECDLGRWKMTRVVLGDVERGEWEVYEAKLITDGDGALYLLHAAREGSDRNVIQAQRMRDPAHVDEREEPRVLLRPEGLRSEDRNEPGGLQLVEGASLAKIGDWWALFYSVGDYALPNYKLGVAYSRELLPAPGETYSKVRVEGGEVGYLLQSEDPAGANYCGQVVCGPGLGSLVELEGEPWLLLHGYRAEDERRHPADRYVWRVPLDVDVQGEEPQLDWLRPEL